MHSIQGNTSVYGIIGNPVSHSISPLLHNRVFEKLKIPAVYVPLLVEQTGPFLKKALLNMGFKGLSVTIPHKGWAAKAADIKDDLVKLTGASNTLIIKDGRDGRKLFGYNTDGPGAQRALLTTTDTLDSKTVVVVGYGGAARAIVGQLLLHTEVKQVCIVGRNQTKIKSFIRHFTKSKPEFKNRILTVTEKQLLDLQADILINTTPLGMQGFDLALPVPEEMLRPGLIAMDIVYTPEMTPFLQVAKNHKARIIPGYWMLLYQAVLQYELFTGKEADQQIENLMRMAIVTKLRS